MVQVSGSAVDFHKGMELLPLLKWVHCTKVKYKGYNVPNAMSENTNANTTDEPLDDITAERDAFRDTLPEGVFILTYHGGEPAVALVERESPPSTEHPVRGEQIVLVEWHTEDDYALSYGYGGATGWELEEELVSTHDSRADAIEAAADLFGEVSN